MRRALLALFALWVWAAPAAAESRSVVVSIKPIYGLAAALLDGIAEPVLLLHGTASPHTYALRPSERRALEDARVVVWVGPELESFLTRSLAVLPDRVRVVGLLAETPGLQRLPLSEDDDHDDHGHDDHGHNDQGHGDQGHGDHGGAEAVDPHMWLSPANARAMARYLAEVFVPLGQPERLARNAAALDGRLAALETALAAELTPVGERPFVVFHPAYNYFIAAFGLHQAGTLVLTPEQGASARHLAELHRHLAETGAVCAFREPQFSDRALLSLARDTGLRVAVLDPLGTAVPAGPMAYEGTLRTMANALVGCLAPDR